MGKLVLDNLESAASWKACTVESPSLDLHQAGPPPNPVNLNPTSLSRCISPQPFLFSVSKMYTSAYVRHIYTNKESYVGFPF